MHQSNYPFSAIVGQEAARQALLLNAVDLDLGGVLIVGHCGSGKTTLTRGLAALLPELEAVAGCAFRCAPDDQEHACEQCRARRASGEALARAQVRMPTVTLPRTASEELLLGSLSELPGGTERRFVPGLLAAANRGLLSIDEIDPRATRLLQLILDVLELGRSGVEQDGIRVEHPARFALLAAMQLGPDALPAQLRDRFALCAEVEELVEAADRVEVVTRQLDFQADPAGFRRRYAAQDQAISQRISRARARLPRVALDPALVRVAVDLVRRCGGRGHRAEIALCRAARALAALEDRDRVEIDDVTRAARPVLLHRAQWGGPGSLEAAYAEIDAALEAAPAFELDDFDAATKSIRVGDNPLPLAAPDAGEGGRS